MKNKAKDRSVHSLSAIIERLERIRPTRNIKQGIATQRWEPLRWDGYESSILSYASKLIGGWLDQNRYEYVRTKRESQNNVQLSNGNRCKYR